MEELESGYHVRHEHCIASEVAGKKSCTSSDALDIREHDGPDGDVWYDAYCWSCEQAFSKDQLYGSSVAPSLGVEQGEITKRVEFVRQEKATPMDRKEVIALIKEMGYKSKNYRGVKDEYHQFFGHLSKLNSQGKVVAQYYPETREDSGCPTGYKIRYHPKSWNKIGQTGMRSELSGQVKFREYKNHRDILIVGGELDKVSAFQMLRDNQIKKGQKDYAPVAVVSPTTGEGSAHKQIKAQYDFLNQFENILIGMDSDDAGDVATDKIIKVLPKDKVKIVTWTRKDPNKMLQEGMERQFLSDFYNAKAVVSNGIMESAALDEEVFKELSLIKVTLPPFMSKLQKLMAGGIPLGVIVNMGAASGSGKTSFINEMLYHWIFNSPYKVGVVSLELNAGQYGLAMLSRHIGRKIQLIEDMEEAKSFLRSPEILTKRKELWTTEDGESRWVLLDERGGSLSELKLQCERMIKKNDAKLIILDPLQDVLDGCTLEDQALFMKWQKQLVKGGVTFININHVRKSGGGEKANSAGADLVEEDFQGSSSIFKSGAANILFMRNKYADNAFDRNTTKAVASKIRWTGYTGHCGDWFYDIDSHTLYDKGEYLNLFPDKVKILKVSDNPKDVNVGGGVTL